MKNNIFCREKGLPQYFGRLRPGANLLQSLKSKRSSIRILLLSGDLKHLLSSLPQSSNHDDETHIEFVLADSNWEVQARNAFLLRMLKRTEEVESWIVKSFIQIYYSLELEEDVYALYFKALREAIESPEGDPRFKILWKEWIKQGWSLKFGERVRNSRLKKAQLYNSTTLEEMNSQHLEQSEKEMTSNWYENGLFVLGKPIVKRTNPTLTCLNPIHYDFKPITPPTHKEEIQWLFPEHIEDRLIYAPHAIDSPFQDWDPCLVKLNREDKNMSLSFKDYIHHMEILVSTARRLLLSNKLKITLYTTPLLKDVKSFNSFFPKESFHVIDTGLMADIQGTYSTLNICYPLLRSKSLDSTIYTHHRIWQMDANSHGLSFKSHVESELGIEAIANNRHDFSNMKSPPCQALTMPDNFLRTLEWRPPKKAGVKLTTRLSKSLFGCRFCGSKSQSSTPLSDVDEETDTEEDTEVPWSSQYETDDDYSLSSSSGSSVYCTSSSATSLIDKSPELSSSDETVCQPSEGEDVISSSESDKGGELLNRNDKNLYGGDISWNSEVSVVNYSPPPALLNNLPTLGNGKQQESSLRDTEIKINSQNQIDNEEIVSKEEDKKKRIVNKLSSRGELVSAFVKVWDAKIERDSLRQPLTSNFKPDKDSFTSLNQIRTSFEKDKSSQGNTLKSPEFHHSASNFVKDVVSHINMSESFPENEDSIIVECNDSNSSEVPRKSSLLQIPNPSKRKRSVTFGTKDILIHDQKKDQETEHQSEEEGPDLDEVPCHNAPKITVSHEDNEELEGEENLPEDYRPPTPPGRSHTVYFPRTPPSTPAD